MMKMISAIFLLLLVDTILSQGYQEGRMMSDEKRLIKDLLLNYQRVGLVGRPVHNTSNTVDVQFGLALVQILDLDEKNQVLTTNVWPRYLWNDILLRWNPEDYGGVDHVRVPSDKIWIPDIVLYNFADTRLSEVRETMAVLSNEGNVLWIPRTVLKSTCPINIIMFPYDEQTCHLKFGSWTYDGNSLDLHFYQDREEVDTTDYFVSNDWGLIGHPAVKNTKYYPCCREPYPDLTFTIMLRRNPIFYSYVLILPCILLSTLTMTCFWLPPESAAKAQLGMNIFVAFFLLLRILAAATPPSSNSIPLLGAFFCLNMILITLSTVLTVIVINISHRVDKKSQVPEIIRKLTIDGLSWLFCLDYSHLRRPKPPSTKQEHITHVIKTETRAPGHKALKTSKKIKSPILKYNKWDPPQNESTEGSPMLYRSVPKCHPTGNHSTANSSATAAAASATAAPNPLSQSEADVREIKRVFKGFLSKIQEQDSKGRLNLEWRVVATVMDRLFFTMYLVTIGVSLFTMFPWPSKDYKNVF